MYIVIFGTDKPGMADTRSGRFDANREYLHDHPDHPGVVVHHAGPIRSEDGSARNGSLIVVDAPSVEAARAFVTDSPFGRAQIYGELHVRPFDWVTGRPEAAPS